MSAENDQCKGSSISSMMPSSTRTEILTTPPVDANDDDNGKRIHNQDDDEEASPSNKRAKEQAWLKYQGKRHTRVGNDYQVNLLPKPSH